MMENLTFDPGSPSFARNPYEVYQELRSLGRPFYFEAMDAWLVSRYDDVEACARNDKLRRSLDGIISNAEIQESQVQANFHDMPNHEQLVQNSMLENDGEMHDRLRLVIMRVLSRRFVEQQHDMIQRHVDRLLDDVIDRGDFDFVADFASHIPGYVIGSVIGVPDEDCPQLRIWSEDIVQYFDVGRTPERKLLAETATTEFSDYLRTLILARRKSPRNDLLSSLVAAEAAGEMNETELVSTCMLILAGGHGSTIDVLGSGMYTLLRFPDQMQALRDNPGHIDTAIQEMFRYESPLPFFHRYLAIDMTIAGQYFKKGTRIGLLYGAANRDPQAFPEPDRFDISRVPNRHVAFGRGAHLCLGNHLARLDMKTIFLTLLARTTRIELLDAEPRYKPGLSARGLDSLKIRLKNA